MTHRPAVRRAFAALAALALCATPRLANASDWKWTFTPYAWATDVGVGVTIGNRQVVDEKIPVTDLVEDLDTIAQFRLEVGRGNHALMVDLFDVTMSDEVRGHALPQDAGAADLDASIGMTILDVAGVYDPYGDRMGVSLVYGVRLINERATVNATFNLASGSTVQQNHEGGETYVDGLLGIRFARPLSHRLVYQMQADLSTGGTEHTWSIAPALSYALGEKRRHALSVGYRRMEVDFEEDHGVESEMTLSGLLIGFRTSF